MEKLIVKEFPDGSKVIKKSVILEQNLNKKYPVKTKDQNTIIKRYSRCMTKMLSFQSRYFITLTVTENNPLSYDPQNLYKEAKKFLLSQNVTFTFVLEKYKNDQGYHIHGLTDQAIDLNEWTKLTESNINDCYCETIETNRIACAKYMLKRLYMIPKNIHHCYTNAVNKTTKHTVILDNEIVYQNLNNDVDHSHDLKLEVDSLATINFAFLDYINQRFTYKNFTYHEFDTNFKSLKTLLSSSINHQSPNIKFTNIYTKISKTSKLKLSFDISETVTICHLSNKRNVLLFNYVGLYTYNLINNQIRAPPII